MQRSAFVNFANLLVYCTCFLLLAKCMTMILSAGATSHAHFVQINTSIETEYGGRSSFGDQRIQGHSRNAYALKSHIE